MLKKIMIALDSSTHARHAVQYAIEMARVIHEIEFMLYHVQPMISLYLLEEARKQAKAQAELQKVCDRNQAAALQMMKTARESMIKGGIDAKRIEIKTVPRQTGLADDLLKAAEAGSYDAILLGRRGLSSLQEMFMGSVTSNLLTASRVIPVWVVDGRATSQKVMVAVDGSPTSLRMVDHVAFIFRDNPLIHLDFFHARPTLKEFCEVDFDRDESVLEAAIRAGDEKCIADFSTQALSLLNKSGIDRERIHFKSVTVRLFTGKSIIQEMKKGAYGTVVIGKMGAGKSAHLGGIASYVIQKISDAAVWVVP